MNYNVNNILNLVFVCVLPADDASSDGSARVIESSTPSTTSIAEDILSLSSSLSSGGGGGGGDVVATPVIVVGFFRPGHGIHHWPKNSLIKAATVSGRACLAHERFTRKKYREQTAARVKRTPHELLMGYTQKRTVSALIIF